MKLPGHKRPRFTDSCHRRPGMKNTDPPAKKPAMSTSQPGFCGQLPPERFNLARYCIAASAAAYPDKTALVIVHDADTENGFDEWTYGRIEDAVLRIAGGLQASGLEKGERIFIRMGNSIDYALMFFAANAAGLVPVPASPALTGGEAAMMVKDCDARAIAADGSLSVPETGPGIMLLDRKAIAGLKQAPRTAYADTHRDDPAYMVYTSGTTSRPKGVVHAQRATWGRRPMYAGWYGLTASDRLLHTGAFNWTYTLGTGLQDPWANGATSIVFTGNRDITVWPRLVRRHGATIMAAVPTLYRQMLKYCELTPDAVRPLRHGLVAGEPLPLDVADAWLENTGTHLVEALGMSEISTYISTPPGGPSRRGSPGRPQAGRCVAILPEKGGEVPLARGQHGIIAVHETDPGLMTGYHNRPVEEQEMRRGEWFVTGDRAHMDEDGFIHFEGRNNDLMNAMGFRVSPLEVEKALL
ncbi:MAG TPA: long-chain fatty acid--CoA ligase, partial [Rhizobiales bacterium]|nr:long-chain fatty acid--CoA ligase [Hyphomicrobiales bacterium]